MPVYKLNMNCHLGLEGQMIDVDDNDARQLAVHGVVDYPAPVTVSKVVASISGETQVTTEVIEPKVEKVSGPEITKVTGPDETKRRGRPRKDDASNTAD